jgi:hypothetical protein
LKRGGYIEVLIEFWGSCGVLIEVWGYCGLLIEVWRDGDIVEC